MFITFSVMQVQSEIGGGGGGGGRGLVRAGFQTSAYIYIPQQSYSEGRLLR